MKKTLTWTVATLFAIQPIHAQVVIDPHTVIGAAIASDIARDRQAEREAKIWPYASPGQGSIATLAAAQDACGEAARSEAGPGATLVNFGRAGTMATGWEVEGVVGWKGGATMPFVCSVRNGSVSGVLLHRPE